MRRVKSWESSTSIENRLLSIEGQVTRALVINTSHSQFLFGIVENLGGWFGMSSHRKRCYY